MLNQVYKFDVQSGKAYTLGEIKSSDTAADIFFYQKLLYIVDKTSIYKIENDVISEVFGYPPLVINGWHEGELGEIFEPRNILCSHGRLRYVAGPGPTYLFRYYDDIESIDKVTVNGVEIPSERYTFSNAAKIFSVSGLNQYDQITVIFKFKEFRNDSSYAKLLNTERALVFGGISNSRPFLWGCDDDRALMFSTKFVSFDMLEDAKKFFPTCDFLYFPEHYEFVVGDGRYPITAVGRHYDRLLIFTEGNAWMADSFACGVEDFPVLNINSSTGALARDAIAMAGNEPCTIGNGAIHRWTSMTDQMNDCNAYSISDKIVSMLPPDFFKNGTVFTNTLHSELWFTSPSLSGKVMVYSLALSQWTSFDGIYAERFIDCGTNIGFISKNSVFIFDTARTSDEGGAEIIGTFCGNAADFECDGTKHLTSVTVCIEGGAAEASVFLDNDTEPCITKTFSSEKYRSHKFRAVSRRFHNAALILTARGTDRQIIRSASVSARL